MAELKVGTTLSGNQLRTGPELEQMGYDSLWVSEHILFYGPILEAVPQLGALAALTQKATLGTAIFLLPLRHPTIVAKSFSTLDVISNGRMVLGIGVGGEFPKEFEATGVPVNERGPRSNEAIRVMKRLWTEDDVTHEGRFFHFSGATMAPKPVQPGGPPIVVAGRSEAAMKRAATLGDGYMPYLFTPDRYRSAADSIRQQREAAGKRLDGFQWVLYQFTALADSHEEAHRRAVVRLSRQYNQDFEKLVDRYCVLGTAEQCAERLAQFVQAGARHIILVPICPEEELMQHLEAYQRDVLPLVRRETAALA
ncbi:MAG TPA: LLM class flavin-dependent oxidoreductase [Dehalococcoidia bacterium]|nr:LLM class flavin-dependent oxidoreductase [Dehalococcoidia bacterium]